MSDPEFKAAVGMSREWDAYGAGVEVAQDTLQKLGDKPDFVLLFATIHHYKKTLMTLHLTETQKGFN